MLSMFAERVLEAGVLGGGVAQHLQLQAVGDLGPLATLRCQYHVLGHCSAHLVHSLHFLFFVFCCPSSYSELTQFVWYCFDDQMRMMIMMKLKIFMMG